MNIESNIRKIFAYILTNRRHFIVLVSIYFLMQPDVTQKTLGYAMALGQIVGFILEVPSGYISDTMGHKKALILAKRSMLINSSCFILASFYESYIWFFIASAFLSISFSFVSGTLSAFTHETLISIGKDKEYSSIFSKIKGKVSLIQTWTFLLFPMIAQYEFMIPFYIGFFADIIWLLIAYSLVKPNNHTAIKERKSIITIAKELQWIGFYPLALFFSLIWSFFMWLTTFREPFLLSIGYSTFLVGTVASWSRLLRWAMSYATWRIKEKSNLKQLMLLDIVIFGSYFILAGVITNTYIIWIILAVGLGYRYVRGPIVSQYIMESLPDPRYKATALSLKAQLWGILSIITPIIAGYLFQQNIYFGKYRDGLVIWWITLLLLLVGSLIYSTKIWLLTPKKQ